MSEQQAVITNYDSNLEALAADREGVTVDAKVIRREVEVPLGSLDAIAKQIIMFAEFRSTHGVTLTEQELCAYMAAIQLSRVGFVQSTVGNFTPKVKGIHPKHVVYPAVFYPLVQGIGRVKDIDQAIEWLPTTTWGLQDIEASYGVTLDATFFGHVESWLHRLEAMGLQLAKAMPKEPAGSYGYVMAIYAEQVVSPTRKASPVDAVVAAILQNTALDSAIRYPFSYGSLTSFGALPSALARRAFLQAG